MCPGKVSGTAGDRQDDRVADAGMVIFLLKNRFFKARWQGDDARRMQG
jgi:hypothetical protein